MKKIIIFDFNQTIYNPNDQTLIKDASLVLKSLVKLGFDLYLISRGDETRKKLIDKLQIKNYFLRIIISKEKSKQDFQRLIDREVALGSSFIVGDRIKQEILFGNALGLQTVWFKNGKFKNELPTNRKEQPNYIIYRLIEILRIVS